MEYDRLTVHDTHKAGMGMFSYDMTNRNFVDCLKTSAKAAFSFMLEYGNQQKAIIFFHA
jgi:hypothetical protein